MVHVSILGNLADTATIYIYIVLKFLVILKESLE